MNRIRVRFVFFLLLLWYAAVLPSAAEAAELLRRIEIPSSFNPVGSGARALGMGGAFIAVADDATAASWNPGGLIQLERPEISMVLEGFRRNEDIAFSGRPEAGGRESVSLGALNYLSAAYPFSFLGRNMVVSLNYQRLFDFTRQWKFDLRNDDGDFPREDRFALRQDGELTALGLAWAAEITPLLSAGIVVNRWDDRWTPNGWDREIAFAGAGIDGGAPFSAAYRSFETGTFRGTGVNIGLLWRLATDLTVGAVWKSPFDADIRREIRFSGTVERTGNPEASVTEFSMATNETLKMPMSYGLGIAWQVTRTFRTALDIHRTEWGDFNLRDAAGRSLSPVSGKPAGESGVGPTHQVRLGAEYLHIADRFILPLTAGVFHDPAPAPGNPDDIYGFSLGTGIGFGRIHLDLAYQYRFGRKIDGHILEGRGFSRDLSEHAMFGGVVVHF